MCGISEIDIFIENLDSWQEEASVLRQIILETGLDEQYKWKQPCYTLNDTNVVILAVFKNHCAISFIKGSLLQDEQGVLISPGENSQSVRYLKYTDVKQIISQKTIITNYLYEAIEIERLGLKVEKIKEDEIVWAEELIQKMNEAASFKAAFEKLTPGRKRAYNMFFSDSKNSSTRKARIEKYEKRILDGYGMNDCTCGLSKRMPNCDGSHKSLAIG